MALGSLDLLDLFRPVARRLGDRFPRTATALWRLHYDLRLLAGDRLWIFVAADLLLVFGALFAGLVEGQELGSMYGGVVVTPALLLGVPMLSRLVALERRAGSLDLALAAPSTSAYFLRRAAAVGGLLWAQAVVLLLVVYVESAGSAGVLLRALLQATLVVGLLVAVCLFWASRLRSAGGVMVAAGFTLLAFQPWTLRSPELEWQGLFLGLERAQLYWLGDLLVLVAAAAIFFLYARERLRRPHLLLD